METLRIEDAIASACDLLRCLGMAFKDLELEERAPLEKVLEIAIQRFRAANDDLTKLRRASEAVDAD